MERRARVLLGLGLLLAVAVAGALAVALLPAEPTLTTTWVADGPSDGGPVQHPPAVGAAGEGTLVFAALGGGDGGSTCQLRALDAAAGTPVWRYRVPPANCSARGVGAPAIATWRGRPTVFVATAERALLALDPASGEVRGRYPLAAAGDAPPVVADLSSGGGAEVLVVDAAGTVHVFAPNGSAVWRTPLRAPVRARPVVGDLSGGGGPQIAVGTGDGRLVVLDRTGSPVRRVEDPLDGAVGWLTSGQLDADPALELVAATAGGQVVAIDGATGAVEWERSFAGPAAVRAVGDADGDGRPEVFAVAGVGTVRSLAGDTGRTVWERTVTPAGGVLPPVLGDVTGDGVAELVVATHNGRIVALEAGSGTRLATDERAGSVRAPPTLADVDGDARLEGFVGFVDGAVVRLDYEA
ncbi:MAG: PQQ-binding-like beta-propeller repeat protein [Halobacteriales archaeon]